MNNIKPKTIILITLIIFVMISVLAYIVYNIYFKSTEPSPNVTYNEIVIMTAGNIQNEQEVVGVLMHQDNRLIFEEKLDQNIGDFIEENIPRWEKSTLEYDTGGMTEDGTLWHGTKTTNISNDDFIIGIYTELEDNWDEYSFDLR